jgi:hypothetical protein
MVLEVRAVSPAVFLTLVAAVGWAHDADVITVEIRERGAGLEEHLRMSPETLLLLAPVDLDADGLPAQAEIDQRRGAVLAGVWDEAPIRVHSGPCLRGDESARLASGVVELTARFACPEGPRHQDFRILRVLPANYRIVVTAEGDPLASSFAQSDHASVELPRAPAAIGAPQRADRLDGLARGLTGSLAAASALLALGVGWASLRRPGWRGPLLWGLAALAALSAALAVAGVSDR